MIHSLTDRVRTDEWMDQPGLNTYEHRQALAGLRRINRWSGTVTSLWRPISRLRPLPGTERLRVLDLACGGGDVTIGLASRAAASNVPLTVHGWDRSPTAVLQAREQAAQYPELDVAFAERDALDDPIDPVYDVVVSTLFLHHLDRQEAIRLLRRMSAAARQTVLIDDLRRTRLGLALAWIGCRLLSRSPIVHLDGPLSVQAAFTESEMLDVAAQAGMSRVTILRHWPERFLLQWMRN